MLAPAPDAAHLPGAGHVHVGGDGRRGAASSESAHANRNVQNRRHAQPAELLRDRPGQKAALLESGDVLMREARFAVVLLRAGGEVSGVLLGQRDEFASGVSASLQLRVHGHAPSMAAVLPAALASARHYTM